MLSDGCIDTAGLKRRDNRLHLVRHVLTGRALVGGGDVGKPGAVAAGAVARADAAAGPAEIAGQGRQARYRAGCLPGVGALVER